MPVPPNEETAIVANVSGFLLSRLVSLADIISNNQPQENPLPPVLVHNIVAAAKQIFDESVAVVAAPEVSPLHTTDPGE